MVDSGIYRHGGMPQLDQERFELEKGTVIDFSVNLNPLGPPEVLKKRWMGLFKTIGGYPGIIGGNLNFFYRKRFGIPERNILAGNGSTEFIYMVPRVFRFKQVVIVTPSYHDYERASILSGTKVIKYPLSRDHEFLFGDLTGLIESIKDSEAVWLGRPNNPTGTMMPKQTLLDLAKMFPDKWFIIDEAFIQFIENWKEESLLFDRALKNIIVIHSLTKFYGIPGLRLAGLYGDENTISRLRQEKEPWTVNGPAENAALFLAECKEYEDQTRSLVCRESRRVFESLSITGDIRLFSPVANFILCQWKRTKNLDDLIMHLLSNGIYIRDCRNFEGLEDNFFRIGLKKEKENNRLLSALDAI